MTMDIGDVYIWNKNVSTLGKNIKLRYFKIISITLTHVYVANTLNVGWRFNVPIKQFECDYTLVKQSSK